MSHYCILTLYGGMLAGGLVLVLYEHAYHTRLPWNSFLCQGMIVSLSVLLRLGPRLPLIRLVQDNKYMLWICMGLLLRQVRPIFEREHLAMETTIVCHGLLAATVALSLWKACLCDEARRARENREPTKVL